MGHLAPRAHPTISFPSPGQANMASATSPQAPAAALRPPLMMMAFTLPLPANRSWIHPDRPEHAHLVADPLAIARAAGSRQALLERRRMLSQTWQMTPLQTRVT